jgi:uncharacterized protein (DUF302 family)
VFYSLFDEKENTMSILYTRDAMGSVDAVGERLEKAAQAHKFGVLNVIDLKAKMASKGVEFSHECRIYEICNPQRAKEVLDSDLSISTALPCRVSLYEEGGSTKMATLLPTQVLSLFGTDNIKSVAETVEADIKAIIDEAAVLCS